MAPGLVRGSIEATPDSVKLGARFASTGSQGVEGRSGAGVGGAGGSRARPTLGIDYAPAMFTGLVQSVGRVRSVDDLEGRVRLWIEPGDWDHEPDLGASIAIGGCCLTVVAVEGASWAFDVAPETLRRTTLGTWAVGTPVNLEHSVSAQTLLGGHVVQGHVDGLGEVIGLQTGADWRIRIRPQPPVEGAPIQEFLTPKGSITVDGVSLTVASLPEIGPTGCFEVALIPETLDRTTLGGLAVGGLVNLEADILAKTVIHWARHYGGR